jgi:SAM-dependent methyltransferase
LGLGAGAHVLDYGASWGYTTWQLQQAGYHAEGYEVSKPRADFARRLGVRVCWDVAQLRDPFDAIYSGHVLEHVPNPQHVLAQMVKLTKPGGFVVAFTPNGSPEAQLRDPKRYRHMWGLVHPVLLTAQFASSLEPIFDELFVSSHDNFGASVPTDIEQLRSGRLDLDELLIIGRVGASLQNMTR